MLLLLLMMMMMMMMMMMIMCILTGRRKARAPSEILHSEILTKVASSRPIMKVCKDMKGPNFLKGSRDPKPTLLGASLCSHPL